MLTPLAIFSHIPVESITLLTLLITALRNMIMVSTIESPANSVNPLFIHQIALFHRQKRESEDTHVVCPRSLCVGVI